MSDQEHDDADAGDGRKGLLLVLAVLVGSLAVFALVIGAGLGVVTLLGL